MAYKKYTAKKRKVSDGVSETSALSRPVKSIFNKSKIHSFRRTVSKGTWTQSSTTTDAVGAISFQLSDVPGVNDFTSLFDQYKLNKVVVHMYPCQTMCTSDNPMLAELVTAIDYDDDVNPLDNSVLREYETCKMVHGVKEMHRSFQPRFATAAYSGAFSSYTNFSGWLDVASPNIFHYGLKWAITPVASTEPCTYKIFVDYYFSFRSTR